MFNSSNDAQDYKPVVLAPLPGELLDKMYRAMPGLDAATAEAVYDLVLVGGYSESMAQAVRGLHGIRLYEARTGLPF